MKKGQKVRMIDEIYLDLSMDLEYYQQFELIYTGRWDENFERNDCLDDDDNPVLDTAYLFQFIDEDGESKKIWLFEDNFEIIKKIQPKTEIEFLDAFQQNFKE